MRKTTDQREDEYPTFHIEAPWQYLVVAIQTIGRLDGLTSVTIQVRVTRRSSNS
jgi:spore germination protein YaaH